MLGLPPFELLRPTGLEAALEALAQPGSRALAGGTDLLVNLKQRLYDAPRLVDLRQVEALRGVREQRQGLRIGASERLAVLAAHPLVRARYPALAQACAKVAHPQARRMGTIGGNVCLDVRCRYVNQSPFWRSSLGGCLKSEGELCHVVPGAKNCVAALSGDTLVALTALGASAALVGPEGPRQLPVEQLRGKDGREPLTLKPGELLCSLILPPPVAGEQSSYHKWSVRNAVDFPLVSVGLRRRPVAESSQTDGSLGELRIAVGVLGPRPKLVAGLGRFSDRPLDAGLAREISQQVCRVCTPLPNVLYEPDYRRRLLGTLVERALAGVLATKC